jgi:hypothetical protein
MAVFPVHCSWGRLRLQALCRSSQGHPTSSTIRPSDAGPTNLCHQWRDQVPAMATLPPAISPCLCNRPTSPSLVSKRSTDLRVPMEARTRWTLQNSLTRSAALIMASTTTLFCLQTTQIELLRSILLVEMSVHQLLLKLHAICSHPGFGRCNLFGLIRVFRKLV